MHRFIIASTALTLLAFALVAGIASAHAGHGHPVKIHDGTCAQLGAAAYTLTGVGANENRQGTPIATPETVNPMTSYQIMVGQSTIGASLASLLARPHAIMVYDGDETMQGVACGSLGGTPQGHELVVGLAELNTPGHTGIAILDDHGATTDVTIYIGHGLAPLRSGSTVGMAMPGMGMGDAPTPAPSA
ncbi:MAG TPA: hypothetical protein VFQ80_08945 [Thermomicrobiales bacterium]|nr:hypothetical protein [Thermomicrobiales bacterium]